jgi:hypothetical protein
MSGCHDRRGLRSGLGQVLVPGAFTLVGSVLALCWAVDVRPDPEVQRLLKAPPIEALKRSHAQAAADPDLKDSPLVVQARAFARQVNPPVPVQAAPSGPRQPVQPAVPSVTFTPQFKLCGTSYCPSQPAQSLALIWEPASGLRWVKQGTDLGHVVIERVRSGSIVYRSGSQTREMEVETEQSSICY